MKRLSKYVGVSIIVVFVMFSFLYFNDNIGISKLRIEKDARIASKIDDRWQVAKDTTNTMSAMLFYNTSLEDHRFSIYVNRKGLSYGYFFRGGGSLIVDDVDIADYYIDGYQERAYMSINKQQIIKMEIDDGNTIETIKIDNTKPFSTVLPINQGIVKFYDINGDTVEPIKIPL